VHYWRMTTVGKTHWGPNDEVDEIRWIRASEAATLLSYEHDRRLIAMVAGEDVSGMRLGGQQ
jgi:hypothetical protein